MYCMKRPVTYSEVGADYKADMAQIINYFQDCSCFQSDALGAVSYTHLDVYKRQPWRRCAQRVHACVGPVCKFRTVCQRRPVDCGSRKYRMVHRSSPSLWRDGWFLGRI